MIRDSRLRVGLLGGTGLVGQRFIQLLDNHPIFELAVIGASERSSKKTYQDAVSYWSLGDSIPENIKCKRVVECKVENFGECKLIFSALDASVAREIGMKIIFKTSNVTTTNLCLISITQLIIYVPCLEIRG